MRISDWSSDVCSSDLLLSLFLVSARASRRISTPPLMAMMAVAKPTRRSGQLVPSHSTSTPAIRMPPLDMKRSEEHTSELQSLMRISYAVFCLKTKTKSHDGGIVRTSDNYNNTTKHKNSTTTHT